MLHHYNYSSPLSHFLTNYHQLPEPDNSSNGQTTPNSVLYDDFSTSVQITDERFKMTLNGDSNISQTSRKSFTIAAILGLKASDTVAHDVQNSPTDLTTTATTTVVNLSVHHQHQQQQQQQQSMTATITAAATTTTAASDCIRLQQQQLPVIRNHHSSYPPVTATCQQQRTVRNLKHVNGTNIINNNSNNNNNNNNSNNNNNNNNNKKGTNSKSKRVRTIFTPEQLERLEAEFERQQYMVGPERLYLAHTLQLTEAQVKVWFQNRRIKWRKHHLEITHQRLAVIKQQQLQQQFFGDATNTDTMDSGHSSETDM